MFDVNMTPSALTIGDFKHFLEKEIFHILVCSGFGHDGTAKAYSNSSFYRWMGLAQAYFPSANSF